MASIATFHELEKPLNEQGVWIFPCDMKPMDSHVLVPIKFRDF